MTEAATTETAVAAPKTSSSAAKKATKPKAKPSHPNTNAMVMTAIKTLKERNGSSLQAIKKYIGANYKVDVVKLAPFIKKAIKSALEKGSLVQTKGKGASGSFKISSQGLKEKKVKKAPSAAAKKTSPVKKASAKKSPKKAVKKPAAKPPAAAKKASKPVVVKKAKTPKKAATKKPVAKKPAAKKALPAAKKSTRKVAPKRK